MSNLGYAFESEIEDFFLSFPGQNKHDPILKTTSTGVIQVNRSFRVPSSGAMDSLAGDVITYIPWLSKQFKVECKSRREKNKRDGPIFNVELAWIEKNNEEAYADNQLPILVLKFKRLPHNRVWWIIKEADFEKLVEPIEEGKELGLRPADIKVNKTRIKLIHKEINDPADTIMFLIDSEEYLLMPHHVFNDVMEKLKNV